MNKISIAIVLLFTIIANFQTQAQVTKPFQPRFQSYVKGNIVSISNSIVNRKDGLNSSNDAYLEIGKAAKLNDEFEMNYIDIDNDPNTFSSSSSTLNLVNKKGTKIVYAGLYWSATYKFEKGKQKKNKKFVAVNKEREAFESIQLKLPNQKSYFKINGEILFDGLTHKDFSESAPYAAYADITKEIQKLENPNGSYTVANIKATTGTISGGVSGGWTIVIVYESDYETGKYITTYDGFAGVTEKSTEIKFSGFQTLPEGEVKAQLLGAALEGDRNLKGDELLFKSIENQNFTPLENSLRERKNFFNSSISLENTSVLERNPNSTNTLGYDSFIITINNPANSVIGNSTKEAIVGLKSTGDRYFFFFCALNIEVIDPNIPIEALKTEEAVKKEAEVILTTPSATQTIQSNKNTRIIPIESRSVKIESKRKGYYLIANVFKIPRNADRFLKKLKDKGIDAGYFINPINNYRYVYVSNHQTWNEAQEMYFSNVNNHYFEALWIMTININ
jgi:hypothetical protein